MREASSVCVVDCNEWLAHYQHHDPRITPEDKSAVLVAATVLAVDNLYVDPLLSIDSVLSSARASAMVRSLSVHISDRLSETLTAIPDSDAYEALITTDSQVGDGFVILKINMTEAAD